MFAPPLSGKLKQKMQLDIEKAKADEQRKQELHAMKLQDAEMKSNQGIQFKTRDQAIKEKQKTEDAGIKNPLPPLSAGAIGSETPTNPESGPNDKIPALLAEGEALILHLTSHLFGSHQGLHALTRS